MLLVLFSAPACLLSGYLALICYRRSFLPQALFLASGALLLLILTIALLWAGYFTATRFEDYSQPPPVAAPAPQNPAPFAERG